MGMAHMAYLMWSEIMNYSPSDPHWFNRDRFVLSNGHACALQYTMLHLTGYKVTMDDLRAFRQLDSITPGHPERGITEGIEVSTGPLGQVCCCYLFLVLSPFRTSCLTCLSRFFQ